MSPGLGSRFPNLLFVDGSAGAAGDMFLGALLELGLPTTHLRNQLNGVGLEGWTLRTRRVQRGGLHGRRVEIRPGPQQPARRWTTLRRILERSSLDPTVRRRALAILRRLFEAEAEVHGRPLEQIHLHEAGAVDALLDIVGACVGLAWLGWPGVRVSALTTGFGWVDCSHGRLPVPAPATLALLRGAPIRAGEIEAERLTPTGAAILAELADSWGELPLLRPLRIGYGAGSRELAGTPNLLRLVLGETEQALADPGATDGSIVVVELDLDDATPQLVAHAIEQLRSAGALDVSATSVTMKKGRIGQRLTLLARPDRLDELALTALRETSSFGLRYRREQRVELERSSQSVRTSYGPVSVKIGVLDGKPIQAWPEYEDCARQARRCGVSLREVQCAALAAHGAGRAGRAGQKTRSRKPKTKE